MALHKTPEKTKAKIQIPIRITAADRVRFRRIMKERHIQYETQLARMVILEYMEKYFEEKK